MIPAGDITFFAVFHHNINFVFLLIFEDLIGFGHILVIGQFHNFDFLPDFIGLVCVFNFLITEVYLIHWRHVPFWFSFSK
jgi:hypothetical protein